MTAMAIAALKAERQEILTMAHSLTLAEWHMPSDCDGWRVQEVVAHMAAVFRGLVEPGSVPTGDGTDVEASAELAVAERTSWEPAEVLAEYEEYSSKAIDVLNAMQDPPTADMVIPMGNLGSYPLHILANALAFDHYCHLRNDILKPNGPIDRPRPADDDLRLGPTIVWMTTGIPQMCADSLRDQSYAVVLELTGPGGGTWTYGPVGENGLVALRTGETTQAVATIKSSTKDFVVWSTKRRPWRDMAVTIHGDDVRAAEFLDAVNVI